MCKNGAVTTVSVSFAAMGGMIPSELAALKSLETLDLQNTALSGTIPVEMPTSLQFIYLSNNSLTGTIPSELSALSLLENLDLSHNSLSGTIPSELSALSLLTIDVDGNPMSTT